MTHSLFAFIALAVCVSARTVTVRNSCSFTIWPATFTDPNAGGSAPGVPTGWQADPNTSLILNVPDNWKAARIWARRNCNFSDPNPATQCASGGCTGGLECDPNSGIITPPVTLGEFTLGGGNSQDFVDVSVVSGFNLPMRIVSSDSCVNSACAVDLNAICPAPLRGPTDPAGTVLGCESACEANLDGNPADSPNCCTGSHNTPATCPASAIAFYPFFKNNCPTSLAAPFDEGSGSLIVCPSGADYTVTFCPAA